MNKIKLKKRNMNKVKNFEIASATTLYIQSKRT